MDVLTAVAGLCRDHQHSRDEALARIASALVPVMADRASVWVLDAGGRQMRPQKTHVLWVESAEGSAVRRQAPPWQPVQGPVGESLAAGRPVEMALFQDWPARVDKRSGQPAEPAEPVYDPVQLASGRPDVTGFGRYIPLRTMRSPETEAATGHSVTATRSPTPDPMGGSVFFGVLAVERRAGRPSYDADERAVLDSIAGQVELLAAWYEQRDSLLMATSQRLHVSGGVLIEDRLLHLLSDISGDVLLRHRFGSGTEFVSAGITRSTGFSPEEFIADRGLARRVLHPDDLELLREAIERPALFARPLTLRLIGREGALSWQYARLVPILDSSGNAVGVEGLLTDVTEMKKAEQALALLARSDPLTGISNRTTFHEFATRALARIGRHGGMVAILFLDLDGFKEVNNTYGHAAGDQLLKRVAAELSRLVRREDVVARLGGDEFAVLLTEISNPTEAVLTAQRILKSLERPYDLDGETATVSTSIGIAISASGTVSPDELLRRADSALYNAKREGRGRWHLHPEGTEGLLPSAAASVGDGPPADARRPAAALSPDDGANGVSTGEGRGADVTPQKPDLSDRSLRMSLAAGEFHVHYLPEIDLETGAVVAVEALARWEHPQLGLLPASAFIEMAGTASVIHPLGDFVFREACTQVAEWRNSFASRIRLLVNVAVEQLAGSGFAATVLQIIMSTGLTPEDVSIEVPETVLDRPRPEVVATLDAIHKAGIGLVLDDFGTGASTLRSLRRFPIETIKLDSSLVNGIGLTGPAGTDEIIDLAMHLADSLGANVVAEGVERRGQLDRLRALRCNQFQGFLATAAQPPEKISEMLRLGTFSYADVL